MGARKYDRLCQYLDKRYAGTVVLRFSEMEDILGFTLPGDARVQSAWWSNQPSEQSACWLTANRTASPNLTAQTVTFTRAVA